VLTTLLVPQGMAYAELADLLLCGHHYRTSCAALAAAGAVIMDDRAVAEPSPPSMN